MVSRKSATARKKDNATGETDHAAEPRTDRFEFMPGGTVAIMLKPGMCARVYVGSDNKVRLSLRWIIEHLGIDEVDGDIRRIIEESEDNEKVAQSKIFEIWRVAIEKYNDSLKDKAGWRARVVHAEDGQALLCHGCLAIVARGYIASGVERFMPRVLTMSRDLLEVSTILASLDYGEPLRYQSRSDA